MSHPILGQSPTGDWTRRAHQPWGNTVPLYEHVNAQHERDEPVDHQVSEYIVFQDEVRRHLNGYKGHDHRNQQIPQAVEMIAVKTHTMSYEFGVCGWSIRPQLHRDVGRLYGPTRTLYLPH